MYVDILSKAIEAWAEGLAGDELVDYVVTCRRELNSPASDREQSACAALVSEIAYDRALITLGSSLGIDVRAARFVYPHEERERVEALLARKGVNLAALARRRSKDSLAPAPMPPKSGPSVPVPTATGATVDGATHRDEPPEALTKEQCLAHLDGARIGRVIYLTARGPVAHPVPYEIGNGQVLARMRTAEAAMVVGQRVVGFEVDSVDEGKGWTVMVRGSARLDSDGSDPAGVPSVVAIKPDEVTGRRVRIGALTAA